MIQKSSVIRQKGESQNGVSRKQSTSNFPKNEHFLPPDTHTYVCVSGGKKCSFFGKFDMLCFLETPILIFVLLPYYRRNQSSIFYSHLCPFQNTPLEKIIFKGKERSHTQPQMFILLYQDSQSHGRKHASPSSEII